MHNAVFRCVCIRAQIPFQEPTVSPGPLRFNSARHTYVCTTSGPYFFGVSAAVAAGVATQVRVSYLGFGVGELRRTSTVDNDLTTLAGKFLMNCQQGYQVGAVLIRRLTITIFIPPSHS